MEAIRGKVIVTGNKNIMLLQQLSNDDISNIKKLGLLLLLLPRSMVFSHRHLFLLPGSVLEVMVCGPQCSMI